jgi:Zn-dependent protease
MFSYALVFGWRYAAGFTLLLFCHEMGHYAAARQRGLDVGAPTFIPFVGAWIQLKELPHNVETEAYIAIAGPVAGSLAALICYFYARWEGSPLLLALAYAGCMLNLFNLLPLSPLDGGRITAIISPKIWWLGIPVLIGLFTWHPSPMLLLIAVLALPHLRSTLQAENNNDSQRSYYNTSLSIRATYTAWYLGLTIFLGLMVFSLYESLSLMRHT